MKIRTLRIENLGPFFGSHMVALSVTPNAPIVLIYGENMRGKTSLLNAIRWCLYGQARGRAGSPKDTIRLMNIDALQAGSYHMTVVLEFDHEGKAYTLERHVQASTVPLGDSDLQMTIRLSIDGQFQPTAEIERNVGSILHEDISRFFLFDGEMLGEYEALLGQEQGTDLVRQSIEKILGLPALQLAAKDLAERADAAEKKQLRAVNLRQKNEMLVAQVEQAQDELEASEKDLANLRALCDEEEALRLDLFERRQKFSSVEADVRHAAQLEATIQTATDEQHRERQAIRGLFATAWWLPVSREAAAKVTRAEEALGEIVRAQQRLDVLRRDLDLMQGALGGGQCSICGQIVSDDSVKEGLVSRRRERSEEIAGIGAIGDIAEPLAVIRDLRRFADPGPVGALQLHERNYRKLGLDIRRSERALEEIQERLKAHDRTEIMRVEMEYEERVARIHVLKGDIRTAIKRCDEAGERIRALRSELRRRPEADRWIVTEAALYNGLESLFRSAIEHFQRRLQTDVEVEATRIFRKLTNEQDYAGLRINDRYGLTIVDKQDRRIIDRSAGAEQVVALSLIGALNHCALREGPIVMDTPFGRLDVGHREKILGFLPSLGPQIVLLVQSGEFNRRRDREYLKGAISRELRIERAGSPTLSRIEEDHGEDDL